MSDQYDVANMPKNISQADGWITCSDQNLIMFGLKEGVILEKLHGWVQWAAGGHKDGRFIDGEWWFSHSWAQWEGDLRAWSRNTIRAGFQSLQDKGIILKMHTNNQFGGDGDPLWRIDYDAYVRLYTDTFGVEPRMSKDSANFTNENRRSKGARNRHGGMPATGTAKDADDWHPQQSNNNKSKQESPPTPLGGEAVPMAPGSLANNWRIAKKPPVIAGTGEDTQTSERSDPYHPFEDWLIGRSAARTRLHASLREDFLLPIKLHFESGNTRDIGCVLDLWDSNPLFRRYLNERADWVKDQDRKMSAKHYWAWLRGLITNTSSRHGWAVWEKDHSNASTVGITQRNAPVVEIFGDPVEMMRQMEEDYERTRYGGSNLNQRSAE